MNSQIKFAVFGNILSVVVLSGSRLYQCPTTGHKYVNLCDAVYAEIEAAVIAAGERVSDYQTEIDLTISETMKRAAIA